MLEQPFRNSAASRNSLLRVREKTIDISSPLPLKNRVDADDTPTALGMPGRGKREYGNETPDNGE